MVSRYHILPPILQKEGRMSYVLHLPGLSIKQVISASKDKSRWLYTNITVSYSLDSAFLAVL